MNSKLILKESEKTPEFMKDLINILVPSLTGHVRNVDEYKQVLDNYRLYNNQIDLEEFKPFLNPLGLNVKQVYNEIKPYNKCYQYIDQFLGEELQRGDSLRIALTTSKAIRAKDEQLKQIYQQSVQEEIKLIIERIRLAQKGLPEEEIDKMLSEKQAMLTPADIDVNKFMSETEIISSKLLKYINFKHDIHSLKNDAFFHALISDTEVVYVGMEYGKPVIKVLNPLYTFFDKSPNVKYIQDGNWAGHTELLTVSDILMLYGEDLTDDDRKIIEAKLHGTGEYYGTPSKKMEYHAEKTFEMRYHDSRNYIGFADENGTSGKSYKASGSLFNSVVPVTHIEIKLMRRIGFLSYINENGEESKTMVDETYEHPSDATKIKYVNKFGRTAYKYEWLDELGFLNTIEYIDIPDVWEVTRISTDIYINARRKPNQYINPENPFDVKLGYHGRRYNAVNADSISIMGRMKPYQFMYFVLWFMFGELLSKTDGPIKDIDASMIDPALGEGDPKTAMEKTLWYLKKGYNIYNSLLNNNGGPMISKAIPNGVANISATQDMLNLANMIDWVDKLIGFAAGISPQRASQFASNTNVSDNQQAIAQSAIITEKYFNAHNKLWCSIMDSFLNIYIKWVKNRLETNPDEDFFVQYVLPDQTIEALKIRPNDLDNADLGIYITNVGADYKYAEKMEQLTLTMIQNDLMTISDVSNIIKSRIQGTSPEEIHKMLEESQAKRDKRDAELQQMQQQQMLALEEERQKALQQAHDFKVEEIKVKAQEDRMTKLLDQDTDVNDNGVDDKVDYLKLVLEQNKLQMEREKMMIDKQLREKEIAAKNRKQQ